MAAFRGDLVKEALWPELLGIATYAGGELILANVDGAIATQVNGYPLAQTLGTAVAIGGSVWAIGKGTAPEFSKGVLYGSIVGLVVNLVRSLYDMAKKSATPAALTHIAALIPTPVIPGLTAAQQSALQAARARQATLAAAGKVPAGVPSNIVQFQYE